MTTHRWRGILVLLVVSFLAGCGLSDPVLVSDDPDLRKIREERAQPIGWSVRVGPVDYPESSNGSGKEWTLSLDPDRIRTDMTQALMETSIFSEVKRGDDSSTEDADLELKIRITRAMGKFEGTNGYQPVQTLLWWTLSSIFACMVADEQYSATLEMKAELEEIATGEPIWSGDLSVDFEGALDHYQKGLDIWDLIPPGTFMATHDPDKVSQALGPHLLRRLQIALARRLTREVPPPLVDVCVIVDWSTRSGASHADRLAGAFSANRARTKIIRLVDDGSPGGLSRVLADLEARKDIRIGDFFLHFHGKGTLIRGTGRAASPALVFPRKEGRPGILDLSKLLTAVEKIPAASRSVIVDAGFRGGEDRSIPPIPPDLAGREIELPRGKGTGLLLAGLETYAHKETGGGILTHHLLKALNKPVDEDGDGVLTLAELHRQISWAVARAARRAGGEGAPLIHGEGKPFRISKKPAGESEKGGQDE